MHTAPPLDIGAEDLQDLDLGDINLIDPFAENIDEPSEPLPNPGNIEGRLDVPVETDRQCWGMTIKGLGEGQTDSTCTPGFVLGRGHLKNKFCRRCKIEGFTVPMANMCVLTPAHEESFRNGKSPGIWTPMPGIPSEGFRVINHTAKAGGGSKLILFESTVTALGLAFSPLPPRIAASIDERGRVPMMVSKGTIVPLAELHEDCLTKRVRRLDRGCADSLSRATMCEGTVCPSPPSPKRQSSQESVGKAKAKAQRGPSRGASGYGTIITAPSSPLSPPVAVALPVLPNPFQARLHPSPLAAAPPSSQLSQPFLEPSPQLPQPFPGPSLAPPPPPSQLSQPFLGPSPQLPQPFPGPSQLLQSPLPPLLVAPPPLSSQLSQPFLEPSPQLPQPFPGPSLAPPPPSSRLPQPFLGPSPQLPSPPCSPAATASDSFSSVSSVGDHVRDRVHSDVEAGTRRRRRELSCRESWASTSTGAGCGSYDSDEGSGHARSACGPRAENGAAGCAPKAERSPAASAPVALAASMEGTVVLSAAANGGDGGGDGGGSRGSGSRGDDGGEFGGMEAEFEQLRRYHLSRRYHLYQVLLLMLMAVWFLLNPMAKAACTPQQCPWLTWTSPAPDLSAPTAPAPAHTAGMQPSLQSVQPLNAVLFLAFNALVAACFPADADLAGPARMLTIGSAWIVALGATLGACTAFTVEALGATSLHVNTACRAVHGALGLVVLLNWLLFAIAATGTATAASGGAPDGAGSSASPRLSSLCVRLCDTFSWRRARLAYAVDGAAFLICNLSLHLLGPPPAYPPGRVTLAHALLRGFVTLSLAALLTPANRRRLAACADAAGLSHVTIDLAEFVHGIHLEPCLAAASAAVPSREATLWKPSVLAARPSKAQALHWPTGRSSRRRRRRCK